MIRVFIVAASPGSHWREWLGGVVCAALMIGPWVLVARLLRAGHRARCARAMMGDTVPL
jgi:hypothetical protein